MFFAIPRKRRAGLAGLVLVVGAGLLVGTSGEVAHATRASVPWFCANGYVCGYDTLGNRMFAGAAPQPGQCTTASMTALGVISSITNASDNTVKLSTQGCAQAAANPQVTVPERSTIKTIYSVRIGVKISIVA